jgi:type 1 glutamine amidotransferase
MKLWVSVLLLFAWFATPAAEWVTYKGKDGPGHGKKVVLLSGDEEYRSEESMPMLGKLLAERHGFDCTVLFSINPTNGLIDPAVLTNIPGIEALDAADLCIMALRYRALPDEQMKHFVDYLNAGKPIIALRTSTHAFAYPTNSTSRYKKFDCHSQEWPAGFGQQVLGETWVNHHGTHGKESTRAVPVPEFASHPILRGVGDIWCPTDVYTVIHLPADAQVLMRGQVIGGMKPDDPPVPAKNNPMMPLVWVRHYTGEKGKSSKIFATTMGAAVDLENENLRRLLVNAAYWAVNLETRIPAKADVRTIGEYHPSWFGLGAFKKGVRPEDLQ